MKNPIVALLFILASTLASGGASAYGARPHPTPAATAHGLARAPSGWLQFCSARPADCAVDPQEEALIRLDARRWRLLTAINRKVNSAIMPQTDEEQWGVIESWDYPDSGKGDCEDYALLKRRLLVEAGLPRRALRLAVVLDENGEGHAVLMVRTDRGDLILDNKRDAVLPWLATGYVFVKRESQDFAGWVSLGHRGGDMTASPH